MAFHGDDDGDLVDLLSDETMAVCTVEYDEESDTVWERRLAVIRELELVEAYEAARKIMLLWGGREAVRVNSNRDRTRKLGLAHDLTLAQWRELIRAYGSKCAYCGTVVWTPFMEHILPVSRGGGTTMANVVPACCRCNTRKRNMLIGELRHKYPLMFREFAASRLLALSRMGSQ